MSAAEADALWPLLVLRTAVLIVSGAQQAALDPDNDYLTNQSEDEVRMFEQATSVPIDVMTAVIRADLGLAGGAGPVEVTIPLVDVGPRRGGDARPGHHVRRLRLRVRPRRLTDGPASRANWPGRQCKTAPALVVTQYGQPRLSRTRKLSQDSPDVVRDGHQPVGGVCRHRSSRRGTAR